MPAPRKRRTPSQKEPIGKTKSLILLWIADHPDTTMTDIRYYLKLEHNVRNVKNIREHVAELEQNGIISKTSQGKGLSDKYRSYETFTGFRAAFNFINEYWNPLEFLETEYFKRVVSGKDFLLLSFLNLLKIISTDFVDIMKDENRFANLLDDATKEAEYSETIENLKQQREKLLSENTIKTFEKFKEKTPEALLNFINTGFPNQYGTFSEIILELLLPSDQQEEILQILSTSPSALDYFLNVRTERKEMLLVILLRFLIQDIFIDPSKTSMIKSLAETGPDLQTEPNLLMGLVGGIANFSNVITRNPLLTIFKSHFIIDAFNGKILENEYSEKALRTIFIPEVKK